MPESQGNQAHLLFHSPHPSFLAMVNYYKILKVSSKATSAEIKTAYRRLARKKHPDVNEGSEQSSQEFALIAKAYRILSDPQERAYYDKKLLKYEFYHASKGEATILDSDNPHARRLRQMAYEKRYNDIIDRMIAEERRESLALQRVIFPLVALFLSTCFVGIFKPTLWTNSHIIGKIVLLTLFIIGILHLFSRLRDAFERYTYSSENIHDSILEEIKEETRPYSRFAAISFIVLGVFVSLGIGLLIGDYLQLFVTAMMPTTFSASLKPELIFYPPIVVLLVDVMHTFSSRLDY
ncbi:MAG TPA: DnaJ domain-containing protein [Pyrinomonadaceae bacterium]|nr:DnaJ domain-containing protein [Pyrinomonadaceae bacterium]